MSDIQDPLNMKSLLTDEEVAIQSVYLLYSGEYRSLTSSETAKDYCQANLQPRVTEAARTVRLLPHIALEVH